MKEKLRCRGLATACTTASRQICLRQPFNIRVYCFGLLACVSVGTGPVLTRKDAKSKSRNIRPGKWLEAIVCRLRKKDAYLCCFKNRTSLCTPPNEQSETTLPSMLTSTSPISSCNMEKNMNKSHFLSSVKHSVKPCLETHVRRGLHIIVLPCGLPKQPYYR